MLLSIIVYFLTGILLFALGWHLMRREQRLQASLHSGDAQLPWYSWEIIVSILLFAVVAGARYHTGYDYDMYLKQYMRMQELGSFPRPDFEPGFALISKVFATFHIHYFFYFAFWAALQLGLLYCGLRHRKCLIPWIGITIMLGPYFVGWMNTVRQVVVECAFVAMLPLLRERKYLLYVLYAMLCMLMHKSAFFLILFIPLAFLPLWKAKRWQLYIIFGCCILIGLKPLWFSLLGTFSGNLSFLGGFEKYQHLLVQACKDGGRCVSWGPTRLAMLAIACFIIWCYKDIRCHFKNDKMVDSYFSLAFVGVCLENVLVNTTTYMLRPVEYLTIFVPVCVAYIFSYLYNTKRKTELVILLLIVCTISLIGVLKAVYIPTLTNVQARYHLFFAPNW